MAIIANVSHFLLLPQPKARFGWFEQCVPSLDIFGIEPILHHRGLNKEQNLYSINIQHQLHPHFIPPPLFSSSDPEETPNLLDGEIGGFASLLPVSTIGLIGLLFSIRKGS